ncbi:MAG: DUF87 domain-containing protein, partial [Nanoarchaeota archaeon]|nr:DUF87 domain-containing protein [Nanoarchaeota archaeon]
VSNEALTPPSRNVTVELGIINLKVDILTPNNLAPITSVANGTEIGMEINATFNEVPITQNMTWSALISEEVCTITSASYNTITETWFVNCTAPLIPENPIDNTLKILGNYTIAGMIISDQNADAITYIDMTPPRFSHVTADSVNQLDSVPTIQISVDIVDNTQVDAAWVVVEYTGINASISNYAKIGNTYIFDFANPNVEAEYTVHVFANDTLGMENSTTGWFDVYVPIYILGSTKDTRDNNQSLNARFYKPGTSEMIHEYQTYASQAEYNFSIRRRNYDVILTLNSTSILLRSFNPASSVIAQHGNNSSAKNLTNGFKIDLVTLRDIEDIGNIALPSDAPDAARNILFAYGIETPFFIYSTGTITLNYTKALSEIGVTIPEIYLRIYRCGSWNMTTRTCSDQFVMFSGVDENNVDVVGNVMSFDISSTSSYALAEWCKGLMCGESPPNPPVSPPSGGDSPSNGGDKTTDEKAECGNGACEIGENNLNCPVDCGAEFPFTVKTTIGDVRLQLGENKTYLMSVTNNLQIPLNVLLGVSGEAERFIKLQNNSFNVDGEETKNSEIYVSIPKTIETGVYTGIITVSAQGKTQEIPLTLRITAEGNDLLSLAIGLITPTVTSEDDLKFSLDLENIGFGEKFNVTLLYFIRRGDTEEIIATMNETVEIIDTESFIRSISLLNSQPSIGNYFLEVIAEFGDKSVKKIQPFDVIENFWLSVTGQSIIYGIILAAVVVGGYVGRRRYKKWKKAKARYVFPVNYNKLPRETDNVFWIGRVAETNKKAWFNPDDLTTHAIVAGSTGAGKSVSASVFVEEALEKKIPVVVFDPTAQWTGFVKSLKDENLLRHYSSFGMDKLRVHPYKGMIYEVTDPKAKINVKKYMLPGEITVFTLNKLKPGQYDEAVKNIISSIFAVGWEESTSLKMIIVFDEVHRLLEKYGGKGGYISLEKACREFRKWGIGLIMCSQVLADFK